MGTFLKRIIVSGATSFWRSGAVSFATVLIMTVTLIIIGSLLFLSAVLGSTLDTIRGQVDVSVYFSTTAAESDILNVKSELEALPQVAQVSYTTRDQALANFKQRHANDTLTLEALNELGNNPLEASLAVTAKDPSEYAAIVDWLNNNNLSAGGGLVDRVNYLENKDVIDRLTAATHTTEEVGLAIVILFALSSIVIALATIRLAIYTARDEIAVMRLVGASNMYIRGPFIVAGIISGALAALIALILFYPATWYAGNALSTWLGGFNLFTYYLHNFALVFLIIAGSGILLGAVASWIGVRRYLKI